MANLIITIIAIALVAVMAIIGIFYGGAAFTNSSSKAKANTLISHAQQIRTALIAWSVDNGGSQALPETGTTLNTSWNNGGPSFLVPAYIQGIPVKVGSGNPYLAPATRSNVSWTTTGQNFDTLVLNRPSSGTFGIEWKTCEEVARIARGQSAVPIARAGASAATLGNLASVWTTNTDFDCIWNDANSNGTFEDDGTDRAIFVLRVF